MKQIAFTGSFDPITKGHLWVVEEGLQISDKLILIMATNPTKKYMFSELERKNMIFKSLIEYGVEDKVEIVVSKAEYVAQTAIDLDCQYLIRGIRSAVDFDYESLLQKANTEILGGAKTIFVMPPKELESVSSSFIKSLLGPVGWHWNIKTLISNSVYEAIVKKYITDCITKYCGLNLNEENTILFAETVLECYANRAYHNIDHIVHAFQELEWFIANVENSNICIEDVALAILSHDIIYGSKQDRSDEELSAQWLKDYLASLGQERPHSVDIVLSTAHLSGKYPCDTPEKELMASIDLAILGQRAQVYKTYSENVRKEYCFIDDKSYATGRIQAIEFLMKKTLFLNLNFEKYEKKAKANLAQEMKDISSRLIG